MKKILIAGLVFLLLFSGNKAYSQGKLTGTISISGAFALYPLGVKWAEEFKKLNPGVKIDISAGGAGKGITDVLSKIVDVAMVSREISAEELKKGAFPFAVARDAVVPTVNAANPVVKNIAAKGLKKNVAARLFINGDIKTWGQTLEIVSSVPVHVYTRSDACGAGETWAAYFNKKQEDLQGIGVFGDPGVAQAVQKDALGIGYNNIAYAYDLKTKKPQKGILVIPIDLNNNGKVDANEDFYKSLDLLVKVISDGRYPSPPARLLYFVTNGKPVNKVTAEFLKWVLKDGQKYVSETGFIGLPQERLNKESAKLK
jgi:phosphate transport system substrate-binding protein